MKSRSSIVCGSVTLLIALLFIISCASTAAQTNSEETLKSKPPTGVYVSATSPFAFTVRLETNGNYQVREELGPIGSAQEQGTWKWNAQSQEFQLTPTTNDGGFHHEFRRLRLDEQESGTLQWIPLRGVGALPGAVDYVRLRRASPLASYVRIAAIPAESNALTNVMAAFQTAGIPSFVHGSSMYFIDVPGEWKSQATEVLKKDAQVHKYEVTFY
jgi:hypothetical protein